MNVMRHAVRILFVIVVSTTCSLAVAQVVGTASNETLIINDLMAPPPVQQESNINLQDDCVDEACSSCCNSCPTVYAQIEALFMKRESQFDNQAIIVDDNTGATFLSTSDLDFDFDTGSRATVGVRLWGGRALEFAYFGLCESNTSAFAVASDPNDFLSFPDNLFGNVFVDIDRADVNYSSWLHSFEMNLPCCCGCCEQCCNGCGDECSDQCGRGEVSCQSFEWFAGFRYLTVGEEFNISAQRIVAGGLEEGSYDIRTTNHLYGVQLGARERRTRGRFGWESSGKVGVFGNDARQSQTVTDFPNFQIRPTVSSSGGTVAFLGEANLSALYRLTDIWNLRAGYNVVWIEGLALAPDQLDFDFASSTGGTRLDNGGGILLHGLNVGVEARW